MLSPAQDNGGFQTSGSYSCSAATVRGHGLGTAQFCHGCCICSLALGSLAQQHKGSSSASLSAGAAPALPAPLGPSLSQEQPPWDIPAVPGPHQAALILLSLPLLCALARQQGTELLSRCSAFQLSTQGKEGAWEDTPESTAPLWSMSTGATAPVGQRAGRVIPKCHSCRDKQAPWGPCQSSAGPLGAVQGPLGASLQEDVRSLSCSLQLCHGGDSQSSCCDQGQT